MLIVLFTACVLYVAIKMMQGKHGASDFGTAFAIVLVPALILFVGNLAIGLLGWPLELGFVVMFAAVCAVFYMSRSTFDWSNRKSALLALIYLLSLIVAQLLVALWMPQ